MTTSTDDDLVRNLSNFCTLGSVLTIFFGWISALAFVPKSFEVMGNGAPGSTG